MRCARVLAPLSTPNFLDAALRARRVGIVGTVLSHSAEEVPKKALQQVAQLRPKQFGEVKNWRCLAENPSTWQAFSCMF